jgi:DNA-binding NarL/FixJ family response regulator
VIHKTRLVLADDHPIVLGGLRRLIEAEDDLLIVGEAGTGLAALDLIRQTSPDVAIVDISMPGLNGIALTRRLRSEFPSVRVLALTFHEDRLMSARLDWQGFGDMFSSDRPPKASSTEFAWSGRGDFFWTRPFRIRCR